MSKAFSRRSVEHNLLDLLIIPNVPPTGCSNHGPLQSVVYMGSEVPELFAVRQISVRAFLARVVLTSDESLRAVRLWVQALNPKADERRED